jgi:raffinose/stachyose/melibiose transport system substrate-binding protein
MLKPLVGMGSLFLAGAFTLVSAQTPVDFWFLGDEVTNPYVESVVEDFNRENPDINVVLRIYPNEAYKTQIQVGLASNDPPDVLFNWAGEDTNRFVRDNQVEDLTSYAQSSGWGNELPEGAIEAFTYEGGVYGAPYSQESKYVYYNKAVFEQESLTTPTSFDELLQLCTTLKERGYTPMSFGNSERWQGVHYLSIFNQKVVGEDQIAEDYALTSSEDDLFTDPGYAEAFQKLVDMKDAGCFTEAANATSPEVSWAQFYTEQVAMTYEGTWGIGIFNQNGFQGKYDFFRMPPIEGGQGNQNYVLGAPIGLEISAKSDSKDAASTFVEYFVSQPIQARLVEMAGRIPVHPDSVDSEIASPEVVKVVEDLATAEGTVLWLDVQLESSISEAYLNVIQEVLAGSKTPQQAAEEVRAAALVAKQRSGL